MPSRSRIARPHVLVRPDIDGRGSVMFLGSARWGGAQRRSREEGADDVARLDARLPPAARTAFPPVDRRPFTSGASVELRRERGRRALRDGVCSAQLAVLPLQSASRVASRVVVPNCSPIRFSAPVRVAGLRRAPTAGRIARARSSSGYFFGAAMTLTLTCVESSIGPGARTVARFAPSCTDRRLSARPESAHSAGHGVAGLG